jgi:mannosyltransferase OCH1-like enzyme
MNWHLNVPKILHVYWGNDPLPYLRYKTVTTFMQHNPDWRVMLWMPKFPYAVVTWTTKELNYKKEWIDFLPELLNLPIEKRFVNMEDFGISNEISEVHKSDFLRLFLLHHYGGVWSDMDILYFQPMTKLEVNTPENKDAETFVCISHYGHSSGFYMANKGSEFFRKMTEYSKIERDPEKYQSNGPIACNKYFPTIESINEVSKAVNIKMDAVYAHDGQHIPDLYNGTKSRFTRYSIGCHWYAGHPLSGEFLNNTNGGLKNLPNCIISNLINYYL